MNDEDLKRLYETRNAAQRHEEERETVDPSEGPHQTEWEKIIAEKRDRQDARTNWDPHKNPHELPPGFHVRGTSTLRRGDGSVALRWEKTSADADMQAQIIREAFVQLVEDMPRVPPVPRPAVENEDLCSVYPMGDPHLGMLSWAPETGENFDLKIAQSNLLDAADWLVGRSPPSKTAILLNLGDFFHADNTSGTTTRGGNILDTDSRWPKMLKAGVHTMIRMVDRALEKHDKVIVRNEIGNHDDHSAIMLSIAMGLRYEQEPRVHIDESPAKFWYHQFGKCLFASTHGNGIKLNDLGEIMSYDCRKEWGNTLFRHWYVGHVHHESVKEKRGVTIETFRTLAGRDAWHHAAGYRSGRDMRCDVWHKDYGLETRHVVGIERLTKGLTQ